MKKQKIALKKLDLNKTRILALPMQGQMLGGGASDSCEACPGVTVNFTCPMPTLKPSCNGCPAVSVNFQCPMPTLAPGCMTSPPNC
ncbi:hypothetical protein [Taibaiella koreensis]|uniref:hypothetical protein n=1 Tax=Taibaiella koreensis TaxID=1268548 RepID=UPI000E59BA46|nr:hypothetical protein [Taibaiella koreensis]